MWWGRNGTTFRGWFAVQRLGALVAGIPAEDFVCTVVNPQDTATIIPTVVESTKGGLYRIDIDGAFFVTHGAGDYGVVIEISTGPPPIETVASRTLYISAQDIDTIVGDTAAAVVAASVDGSTLGARLALLRKLQTNRLEESPGDPGAMVLYDDDSITPLLTWQLRDYQGGAVDPAPGAPSRRSKAT